MSGGAATQGDAGTAKLMAHAGPRNAQLGTDLAQGPTLGVQVGCRQQTRGRGLSDVLERTFKSWAHDTSRTWSITDPANNQLVAASLTASFCGRPERLALYHEPPWPRPTRATCPA
jgi:hypothetical protein